MAEQTNAMPLTKAAQQAPPGLTMEALQHLYEENSLRMFRFFRLQTGSPALAEELVSLCFTRAISRRDTFRPGKGTAEGWLFTIAKNTLRDHFRAAKKRQDVSLDACGNLQAAAPTPEEQLLAAEDRKRLEQAFRKLSKREQMLLALRYAGGLRNTQIAGIMGISEKNTGVILSRCMKKLAKHMNEEDPN